MTTAPAYKTHSIDWAGDNLADVQAFVGQRPDYDRVGIPLLTEAFTVAPDGIARLWMEEEKAWVEVPIGHRIFRDLLKRRWALSPQAMAATRDPIASAIVDVVVKPADAVQENSRRLVDVLRQLRQRHAR